MVHTLRNSVYAIRDNHYIFHTGSGERTAGSRRRIFTNDALVLRRLLEQPVDGKN